MTRLTKDTKTSFDPGSPAVPGTPGTPTIPGHYETTTVTTPAVPPTIMLVTKQFFRPDGGSYFAEVPFAVSGKPPVTTTTTIFIPTVQGTPGTPGKPGTAASLSTEYNFGWNSGAVSIDTFAANGEYSFSVPTSSIGVVTGLNGQNEGEGYFEIDYGLFLSGGMANVRENGVSKGFPVPFTSSGVFTIQRTNGTVTYKLNGSAFYTSLTPSTGPLFADASLYAGGDSITDASIAGQADVPSAAVSAASLRPLQGFAADHGYASSEGELEPLISLGGETPINKSDGSLQPFIGRSSNYEYTSSEGVLPPFVSNSGADDLAPDYCVSAAALSYLLPAGLVLTGEILTGTGSFAPLGGLSADRSYAEARGSFLPMEAFGGEAIQISGYAQLQSGSCSIVAHGAPSENIGRLTMPSPFITAFTGGSAQLRMGAPLLAATGTFLVTGRAELTMPSPFITASGTLSGVGSAELTVQQRFAIIGYSGAVCAITLADKMTITASGTTGGVGRAELTMPLFELTASGTAQNFGRAELVMPALRMVNSGVAWLVMPGFQLTAIGSAVVDVAYEAYSVNLGHSNPEANNEVTRYTNYPFDRIVRYKNSYFGANSTGLYLLEGTTDDAAPITYSVKTKLTDFGMDQMKTPEAAIFGGRLGPDATVTVYTGETEDDVYAYTTPRGQDVQNYRQKFGKGLKARYYAFGIQGEGAMTLDTVSFDIAKLKRRI